MKEIADSSTTPRPGRRSNAAILVAAAIVCLCPGQRLAAQDTSPRDHVRIATDAAHAEVTVVVPTGVYDGGWAVAFCLDGLIRERSSDRASLDDVLRALWKRAAAGGRGYSVPELDTLADRLAGGSLGGFLARHVAGGEVLPLRACLERVGLTGAFKGYAAEAFLFPDGRASAAASSRGRALHGVR